MKSYLRNFKHSARMAHFGGTMGMYLPTHLNLFFYMKCVLILQFCSPHKPGFLWILLAPWSHIHKITILTHQMVKICFHLVSRQQVLEFLLMWKLKITCLFKRWASYVGKQWKVKLNYLKFDNDQLDAHFLYFTICQYNTTFLYVFQGLRVLILRWF